MSLPYKPNDMSFEEARKALSTLNGLEISHFSGKPEIVLTHNFARALEVAIWSLSQPERQDTALDEFATPQQVTLHGQCIACGTPVSKSDNYCSHCGRRFNQEAFNGRTQE